jgi:hypothetical protein
MNSAKWQDKVDSLGLLGQAIQNKVPLALFFFLIILIDDNIYIYIYVCINTIIIICITINMNIIRRLVVNTLLR